MHTLIRIASCTCASFGLLAALASNALAACETLPGGVVRCTICGDETCCDAYFMDGTPTGTQWTVCYPT